MAVTMLPAMVTVDAETLVDVVAHMLAFRDVLDAWNSGEDTHHSEQWAELGNQLLVAAGAPPDGDPSWYHDSLRVEAYARGHTLAAEWFDEIGDRAQGCREMAAEIRAAGDALAWTNR